MNKEKLIILKIIKIFQGKIVNNYPCKGTKFSEATPQLFGGVKGCKSPNGSSEEKKEFKCN